VPVPLYEPCGTVFSEWEGHRAELHAAEEAAEASRARQAREDARHDAMVRLAEAKQHVAEWLASISEVEERLVIAATHLTEDVPSGGAYDVRPRSVFWTAPNVLWDAFPEVPTEKVHNFIAIASGTDAATASPVDSERLAYWFRDRAMAVGIPPRDLYVATKRKKAWWSDRMKDVTARPVAAWKVDDAYVLAAPNNHGRLATSALGVFHLREMGLLLSVPAPPAGVIEEFEKRQSHGGVVSRWSLAWPALAAMSASAPSSRASSARRRNSGPQDRRSAWTARPPHPISTPTAERPASPTDFLTWLTTSRTLVRYETPSSRAHTARSIVSRTPGWTGCVAAIPRRLSNQRNHTDTAAACAVHILTDLDYWTDVSNS
jgi:hypothetical protein